VAVLVIGGPVVGYTLTVLAGKRGGGGAGLKLRFSQRRHSIAGPALPPLDRHHRRVAAWLHVRL